MPIFVNSVFLVLTLSEGIKLERFKNCFDNDTPSSLLSYAIRMTGYGSKKRKS